MNVYLSFKAVISPEDKIINWYLHHLEMILTLIENITFKDHHILNSSKQKEICDYNYRCLISIGLMFDDIIMNILRKKAL